MEMIRFDVEIKMRRLINSAFIGDCDVTVPHRSEQLTE